MVEDRCFQHLMGESSIDVHRDPCAQGCPAPRKLDKFILIWVHTIMGSSSATWHTLHSHLSSSTLTRLSLPTYARVWEGQMSVCVSVCECACKHKFSNALLCTLFGYQNPLVCFNILIHACNLSESLKFSTFKSCP